MEIENSSILILGGSGLVGLAVARELLPHRPARIVLSGLTRAEAESAAAELGAEPDRAESTEIDAEWGDLFVPAAFKDRPRAEILADPAARTALLDDLFGELTEPVVARSTLGALLLRRKPNLVIDCVNTATAFAYQNVFESAASLRHAAVATDGSHGASIDAVEQHLATLYMPQLIRHVQIALDAMRRAGTVMYLKIGTAGTGGMGLNIPFTHSEERPSRTLLAKSGVAGAHTLLLYLMARTPGAPAVKEIKPTAAISWKRIGYGEIGRRGRAIRVYDATTPLPLDRIVDSDAIEPAWRATGDALRGVFIDAGENGLFSADEFEALTALGLMEYITPEEIARDSVSEILGHPTGHDVVAALDAATTGPTYRAGVMRATVLERMARLEAECGGRAVAYEMLGPPRLSKLLFEAELLARLFGDLREVAALDAESTADRAAQHIADNADLRQRIVSIGLPILLPDGRHALRGPEIRVAPEPGQAADDPRVIENGWVDLRPSNWRKWCARAGALVDSVKREPGPDAGSRSDIAPEHRRFEIRPGAFVAWIFRYEDRGERNKR